MAKMGNGRMGAWAWAHGRGRIIHITVFSVADTKGNMDYAPLGVRPTPHRAMSKTGDGRMEVGRPGAHNPYSVIHNTMRSTKMNTYI